MVRLLGAAALNRLRRGAVAPFIWLLVRPVLQPGRLVIAPQDIRTADPVVASDIYAGFFALAGKVIDAHGRSPFELEPPSPGWAETLHGFGWLRHLRAADTSLSRANAQALVADWLGHARHGAAPLAWQPAVVARRLISWLSQSPAILNGADGKFYRQFLRSIAVQATLLQRGLRGGLEGEARLLAALALAEVGLCSEDGRPYRRGARIFLDELNRQVLGDGGHLSRDPTVLVDLLLDLLPLRQAYVARGTEVPAPLLNAIDRMMPMVRLFRHSDGAMALFNGMGVTQPDALATILAYDDTRGQPLSNASRSGYQRVEAGPSILICDTGRPPPPAFARRAHAGTLSFEFSSGGQRLITNCGRPGSGSRAATAAGRATAAHSTLVIADTSSSRLVAPGLLAQRLDGALVNGPRVVEVERRTDGGVTILEASHDGYRSLGFTHKRRLSLHESGERLEGEDRLVTFGRGRRTAAAFALRFHLHPLARPTAVPEGRGVLIVLGSGGQRWLFETDGPDPVIEPSIFFASADGPRHTEQIVIEGRAPDISEIRWSLVKLA